MRINRLLQGMAVTALAAAAWTGTGAADASASININNVSVNTDEQQIVVTPGTGDKEVLFGIAKKGNNKKAGKTVFKVSVWDIHDVNGSDKVTMDLSTLNATRDNFVAVMTGDMATPYIIRIPASDKVNVLTYNAQKHELDFKAGDNKNNAVAVTAFQYRTPGGGWTTVKDNDIEKGVAGNIFSEYQSQGASLYVRTCAVEKELEIDSYYSDVYDATNLDNKLEVYTAGTLPGKISKLNIARQANGPSVPVQYAAGTLTLPKAAEYRVLLEEKGADGKSTYKFKEFQKTEGDTTSTTNIEETDATKATTGVKVDTLLSTVAEPATAGSVGILEVRTKEKVDDSSPKKAKCASKWTRINIEVTAPLTDEELGGAATIASASSVDVVSGGAGVFNAVIKYAENKVVTVAYGDSENKDGIWKGKIRFINIGSDDYQIVVSNKKVDDISELPTTGVKTLAAGNVSTKIAIIDNVESGSYIYIRKAANQSKKKWAGVYRLFGVADIPKK